MSTPYRFIAPVPRRGATGQVAAVYEQSARELGVPFSPHLSPAPEVHAALWSAFRESQLVGQAPRGDKEIVAAAVSAANRCAFCTDAHAVMIHAGGDHETADAVTRGAVPADAAAARLVAWAQDPAAVAPPFPDALAREYLGTLLANHFINRMMDALRPEPLLPANPTLARVSRRALGVALGRTVRRTHQPGVSLLMVDVTRLGSLPPWAGDSAVGAAFAALREASQGGAKLLDPARTKGVRTTVAARIGAPVPLGRDWTGTADPAARLAVLAALAPARIAAADVAAWRRDHHNDGDLVRLLAFGAWTAVEQVAQSATSRRDSRTSSMSS
jgi:AhpD family alkylhydroperoxidase